MKALAVLLLFVTLGKKKLVNVKIPFGMIALSIGVSLLPVIEVVRLTSTSSETYLSYEGQCPSSGSQTDGKLYTYIMHHFLITECLAFVFHHDSRCCINSVLCCLQQMLYTQSDGDDTRVDRRMLSLSITMTLFMVVFEVYSK